MVNAVGYLTQALNTLAAYAETQLAPPEPPSQPHPSEAQDLAGSASNPIKPQP